MTPEQREVLRTAGNWFDGRDGSSQELRNAVLAMRRAEAREALNRQISFADIASAMWRAIQPHKRLDAPGVPAAYELDVDDMEQLARIAKEPTP